MNRRLQQDLEKPQQRTNPAAVQLVNRSNPLSSSAVVVQTSSLFMAAVLNWARILNETVSHSKMTEINKVQVE